MTADFTSYDQLDGRALMWLVEVSTDKFATVLFSWSTHSGTVVTTAQPSGGFFDGRIPEGGVGNVSRQLSVDHIPVATTTELKLDNTDFIADWLLNRTIVATTLFKARFRISVAINANGSDEITARQYGTQPTMYSKQIGEFVCFDFPSMVNSTVTVSLTDDSLGQLSDILVPPTVENWMNDAGTDSTNAPFLTHDITPVMKWNIPLPIQLGPGPYVGQPMSTYTAIDGPAYYSYGNGTTIDTVPDEYDIFPIAVLATRDSAVVSANDVTGLRVVFKNDVENREDMRGTRLTIPRTFNFKSDTVSDPAREIWKAYKTQTLTINGYDWKILWIGFSVKYYMYWASQTLTGTGSLSGELVFYKMPVGNGFGKGHLGNPDGLWAAFDQFLVDGTPGSNITGKAAVGGLGNAMDAVSDLVVYYSTMGAGTLDTTRMARARKTVAVRIKGDIIATGEKAFATQTSSANQYVFGVGTLRKTLSELSASSDFDLFVTSTGLVAVIAQGADFDTQTTTYPTIDESQVANISVKIPSVGERWAPYNRVFVTAPGGVQIGPLDNPAAVASWGRIMTKVVNGTWWYDLMVEKTYADHAGTANYTPGEIALANAWSVRGLESNVRPVITFTTDIYAIEFELGDYFFFSWTRGGQQAFFSNALWRLEGLVINGLKGSCEVTAVWMGDLQADNPFLLDDETFLVRTTPGGGQTLTVTDGSTTVTRSAGSFITDGVAVGDLVVLRDSSESILTFYRNRQVKVASITNATNLVVSGDVDFGTAGAHVLVAADWSIIRSYRTYPTSISDATNYPNEGVMYGKVSDASGLYSDSTTGNKLLDG